MSGKSSLALLAATVLATAGACNCGRDGGQVNDDAGQGGDLDGSASGDGGNLSGDGGAGSFDAGIAACATTSKKAQLTPLDLMIVQDTSYSMDFDWKWVSVKSALKAFVANPAFAGMGVAVQYFPARAQCNVSEYATPAVPMGVLPLVASSIETSLDEQRMSGGTPMVQVLEGSYDYAKTWAGQHPERKLVVLLATDGIPDSTCAVPTGGGLGNGLDNVIQVVTEAAKTAPRISTFAIGVGTELTALDQIALAGGTKKSFIVDANHNTESDFLLALNAIRGNALTCDTPIPAPESGKIDYERVGVVFTPEGGSPQMLDPVQDAAGCQGSPLTGWYYDDPSSPTRVVLCDGACQQITARTSGQLDLLFGCKTIPN